MYDDPAPKFIFLTGASQSGKTSVGEVFLKSYHNSIIYHTYDLLRDALMHTVYGEPTFDEYTQAWKDTRLPLSHRNLEVFPYTNRDWMNAYQKFLRSFHGEHIMGELAARNVKHFGYIRSRVVIIDSLRTNIEMNEFLSHFHPDEKSLIVSVHRKGFDEFSVGERLSGKRLINVRFNPEWKTISTIEEAFP